MRTKKTKKVKRATNLLNPPNHHNLLNPNLYPREESNLYPTLRTRMLFPLSYGGSNLLLDSYTREARNYRKKLFKFLIQLSY